MISAYLIHTGTLKTATLDKWGKKTFSSTTVRCRIEEKTRLVRNQSGEQVVSDMQVMLENRTVTHNDKFTVNGVDRSIIAISKEQDFSNVILWLYLV
ncbi:MAG: hypothetical protein WC261_04475 [Synergistaceae bacterium]|jgi:hypothetical protein